MLPACLIAVQPASNSPPARLIAVQPASNSPPARLAPRRHAMISWADPDLMPKAEWDREYADVIMAGTLGGTFAVVGCLV